MLEKSLNKQKQFDTIDINSWKNHVSSDYKPSQLFSENLSNLKSDTTVGLSHIDLANIISARKDLAIT